MEEIVKDQVYTKNTNGLKFIVEDTSEDIVYFRELQYMNTKAMNKIDFLKNFTLQTN